MNRRFAMAVALGGALTLAALSNYEDMDAARKQGYLWTKIVYDTTSGSFMDPLTTLWDLSISSNLWAMTKTHSDWRDPDHKKMTHGLGAVAKAHFEWKTNEYSGMFQKADKCVVRMANAAAPGGLGMTAYGPNLAVKCLRDGVESANMQFIWQLDGYAVIPKGAQNSCSYFEAPLSNHCPARDDISGTLKYTFLDAFQAIDKHSMFTGLSQMAVATQDGTAVKAPHFPFALVLKPAAGLNKIPCEYSKPISQLLNIPDTQTTALYEVYAVRDPSTTYKNPAALEMIGTLVLDGAFTSTLYGDTELFFRHIFFDEEMKAVAAVDPERAAKWGAYANNKDNYQHEGANIYWPLLPGGAEEIAELAARPQMLETDVVVV